MTETPPAKKSFNFKKFLTPAWLAGAISVGFHGVLFAAGPTFSSLGFEQLTEAEEATERRNVPLVELTAGEQERLPDFSGSFYNFDEFSSLDPLDPLFQEGGNSSSGDRALNSQPLLSPRSNSLPPSGASLPFGITRLESGSSNPFPLSGGSLPGMRNRAPGGNASAGTTPAEPTNNAKPPGADALRTDPNGAAQVSPQEEQDIAANSNPTDTLTLEERLQAYTFDDANTNTEAIATSYDEWLESGQALATELEVGEAEAIRSAFAEAAEAGILTPVPADEAADDESTTGIVRRPIELEIEHGAGICLTKEPQKGLIGAWVGPEGKLLGEPTVIRSTGYLGLNQQAIRYVKTLDFSAVESFTGYQFEVLVTYDPENCVEVGRTAPAAPADEADQGIDSSDAASKSPAKAPARPAPNNDDESSSPASATPDAASPSSPDAAEDAATTPESDEAETAEDDE